MSREERLFHAEPPAWAASLAVGLVALLAVEFGAWMVGTWPALNGTFMGPDSYMRVHRVLECLGGPGCMGGIIERSNAPFGEVLHWPWLWDRLILAVSAPLQLFLPLRQAVIVAAYVTGPLLGILSLLALTLAAGRAGVGLGLPFVGLLMVTQLQVVFVFSYARPDHHAIQTLVFACALLSTLATLRSGSLWAARAFGVALGVGVWISTEGLITALPLLMAVGLLWVIRGGRSTARLNREATLWASGTAAAALAVDAPIAGLLSAEFDRISVVHLVLFGAMACFWAVSERWSNGNGTGRRLLWGVAGAGATFLLMSLLFPGFQRGPAADVPDPLWTLWLEHTSEYVPLYRRSDASQILKVAIPALVAIPLSLLAARSVPGTRRGVWYTVGLTILWFQVLATFQQVRWSIYVHLLSPLPLAWLLGRALERIAALNPPLVATVVRIATVCAVAVGPVALAAAAGLVTTRTDYTVVDRCEPGEVMPQLAALRTADEGAATVLMPIFWGPQVLWRTIHQVIATPYHRNIDGIMDSHRIMSAGPEEARERLAARGVTHIAVCRELPWVPFVSAEASPESFYAALVNGPEPNWVTPLPLPEDIEGIGLFSVEQAGGVPDEMPSAAATGSATALGTGETPVPER